jgi:hypothetical protein
MYENSPRRAQAGARSAGASLDARDTISGERDKNDEAPQLKKRIGD